MNMIDLVIETILEVIQENGLEQRVLEPSSILLQDTGLDSLALAEVLVKLELNTGKDPFKEGFVNFRTPEELARLYEA